MERRASPPAQTTKKKQPKAALLFVRLMMNGCLCELRETFANFAVKLLFFVLCGEIYESSASRRNFLLSASNAMECIRFCSVMIPTSC